MKRILCLCICSIWLLCVSTVSASENEMALLQGYEAFRSEDWVSALFFFRADDNLMNAEKSRAADDRAEIL